MHLEFDSAKPLIGTGTLYRLGGADPAMTNTLENPKRIVPAKSQLKVLPSMEHTVPPYSIEVLVLTTH